MKLLRMWFFLFVMLAVFPFLAEAQTDLHFRVALEEARDGFGRLAVDWRFRLQVVNLADAYIAATVRRQTHSQGIVAIDREIEAGDHVLAVLLGAYDDVDLHELSWSVQSLRNFQLDEIAQSFRKDGFARVIASEFPASRPGIENDILAALAFYAVASLALIQENKLDPEIFRPGEFCILPFWPFC